ncbi:MAG: hypothetical protein K2X56_12870 [Mycobacterium pseudokansasii]|uniref:hypothetical protein n=1 Tax=Mycobacterium pseudokansasii TaxID=2341080 RepID=UPI0023F45BFB|nr:hypothetical protein [Mycobacterium pseudokansasii]MBY0388964.1 hypothetical protein [Mycobacterium pseudokansasii]
MSDEYPITIEDEWAPWPQDLDPVEAAGQLTDSPPADPHASLIQLLRTVPAMIGAAPALIDEGSRMDQDRKAAPDLLNLPMMCHNYLAGSADFLKGLYRVMRPRPNAMEIPRFAAYPLIRGVIESGGQTVWVLSPGDQHERFRRLLQIEKSEMDHDRGYIRTATVLHDDDTHEIRSRINEIREKDEYARRARWKRLLDAAAVLGIAQSEFEHGLSGGYTAMIGQVMAEEHERDRNGQVQGTDSHWLGRYSAGVWYFISGMSHPSMSRGWAGSLHEPGEIGPDGYHRVKTSANPVIIRDALLLALRLHMRAIRLWTQASCAHTQRSDGSRGSGAAIHGD